MTVTRMPSSMMMQPNKQSPPPTICTRNATSQAHTHSGLYAVPSSYRFFDNVTCGASSSSDELGIDNARLPVLHLKTRRENFPNGEWFYYARGCSDLAWDMGRTLMARDRCDAAVKLHRRVHRNQSLAYAISSIASRLRADAAVSTKRNNSLTATIGFAQTFARFVPSWRACDPRNVTLEALIHECARGVYDSLTSPCDAAWYCPRTSLQPPPSSGAPCMPRALALAPLAGRDDLDAPIEAALRALAARGEAIDTIQLVQQPQFASPTWSTEIWDVRWFHAPPNETLSEHALRRHANRAVVQLAPGLTLHAASKFAHRLDGRPGCNLVAQVESLPDVIGAAWGCES